MKKVKVLLVGESWMTISQHYKGFDHFTSATFCTGHAFLKEALARDPAIEYSHLEGHYVQSRFPYTLEELNQWDVIIISDVGANSFLLSDKVFVEGKREPNRLALLKEWVEQGGGLAMAGGYLSFSGFQAAAKYFRTPLEKVLPVDIYPFDDRVETPEGTDAQVLLPDHPILKGVPQAWPHLLGYQEVVPKEGAQVLVKSQYDHPLLAVMERGKGRTLAWASDIGPHWCPKEFVEWEGYAKLWQNAIHWLAV